MLGVGPVFPSGLLSYGLNEDLLAEVFHQVQNDKSPSWCLRGIPDYGFYQDLHQYLKKWPHTQDSSKVSIGKFYSVIDLNLRRKALRPDNAYRFVDRLASSKYSRDSVVRYQLDVTDPSQRMYKVHSNVDYRVGRSEEAAK